MPMGAAINSQQRKEMGKMRKSYLKKVATKSFVGRVLRRLLGEEKGTVMMEYIVVGLLVVAVAVGALAIFGNYVNEGFNLLTAALFNKKNTIDQNFPNIHTRISTATSNNNAQHVNVINADNPTVQNDQADW